MDEREQLEKLKNEFKKLFLEDKKFHWYLFGAWTAFLIIGILEFLGVI